MTEASLAAAERDRWVGRTLDDAFRVDAPIGEGAMGRVYRGVDVRSDEPVALKLLHKHLAGDPRIAKRFHREARAARRLSHPNSLVILDFGQTKDGALYIAMELLDGEDLQTVIDHDAPFSPRRILELMSPMLSALHEAHAAGIIHRDLKPENVVLATGPGGEERVKVCDFGMAKIIESEGRSTAITKDGYVCGTPEYMAPEQAKGDPLDVRADVYAAGVILFQLLTGRVPFKAETALGLITKHIMDAPPRPRQLKPEWGIPRSLEAIALKALEKKPDDRYADAAALEAALREAVEALGKDADARLGSSPFKGSTTTEVDAHDDTPAAGTPLPDAPNTAETIARAVPPASTSLWRVAPFGAVVVLAVGVFLWMDGGYRDPTASPVARPPVAGDVDPLATTVPATPTDPSPETVASPEAEASENATSAPETAPDEPETASNEPETAPRRRGRQSESESESESGSAESGSGAEPASETEVEAPPVDPGRAAFEAGRAHLLRGELPEALRELGTAARLRPRGPAVQRELGRAHVRAGDVAEGVAAYRRYLALAPNAPDRAVIERIIAQHL